jgi:hypothetical protein
VTRVVADTNIFISALLAELAEKLRHKFAVSPPDAAAIRARLENDRTIGQHRHGDV